MKKLIRAATPVAAMLALASCGGDSAIPPGTQGIPPEQATEAVPPRTSTYVYPTAFSLTEPRQFDGDAYEVLVTRLPDLYPDGSLMNEYRLSPVVPASFEYDPADRSATFIYDGETIRLDPVESNLSESDASIEWHNPSERRILSFAGYKPGVGSPYIASVRSDVTRADGTWEGRYLIVGSRTRSDDMPPRGIDVRPFQLVVERHATRTFQGDQGSARFSMEMDYAKNRFKIFRDEKFTLTMNKGSEPLFGPLLIEGTIDRATGRMTAELRNDQGGTSGTLHGFCYGPYCEDIYLLGTQRLWEDFNLSMTLTGFE
ncbi:hypothetical protein [Alteriqipengyuania sp. 357]